MKSVRDETQRAALREAITKQHQEIIARIKERTDFSKDQIKREIQKQTHRMKFDIEYQLYYGPQPYFDHDKEWSNKRDQYIFKKMEVVYKDDPTLLTDEEVHRKLVATYGDRSDEDFEFWHEVDQIRRGNPEARWQSCNQTYDQRHNAKYQEEMAELREKTLARQAEWKRIWAQRVEPGSAPVVTEAKAIVKDTTPAKANAEPEETIFGMFRKVFCG